MIRPFHPADASECCRIVQACVEADTCYSFALRSRLHAGETPRIMAERAALFYVAVYESGGRVLGLAGLDLNEIRLLYVDPGSQRRGIGRALLEHLAAMVPDMLFREIFVYSTLGAIGFYESCGFKNKGLHEFNLGDISMQTVFMALPTFDSRFTIPNPRRTCKYPFR